MWASAPTEAILGVWQGLGASLPQSPAGDSSSYEEEPKWDRAAGTRGGRILKGDWKNGDFGV